MPSQVSDEQLGDALLQSAAHGAFPQDEDVASATVPSSALPKLLEVVAKAREDTKNEVRQLSREAAPDVDGWIAQARKLQDDIKRSQETAKDIVKQAEAGKENTARVQDAASKVSLLHTEIAYNESLAQAVEQLRDISTLLDSAQSAAVHGHVMHAIQTLEDADGAFQRLGSFTTTRVVGVLKNKEEQLKRAIVETVTESWNGLISVDNTNHKIALHQSIEREAKVDINTTVEALTRLGLLDSFVTRLSRDLDKIIIFPRLAMGTDRVVSAFRIQEDVIQRAGPVNDGCDCPSANDVPEESAREKTVERVETQVISKGDALHAGNEQEDDWAADWDEEGEATEEKKETIEEEDMSAWGEDDEVADDESKEQETKEKPADAEDADDWGADWDDETDTKPTATPKPAANTSEQPKTNGKTASQKQPAHQEVTLRETYTVTAIPDAIMEIILQVIVEVDTLNSPELVKSAIAPASGGLYAIPSLLLAMYRATAVMHYSKDIASNMLIYNDCQRLSDRLQLFLQEQAEKDKTSTLPQHLQPSRRLKPMLESDIKTIDGFGKRAYGREMESQRQIIRDHLEDAQGFQGCTNVPFATVCDDAIATTIDRIGDVKRQWQNVLSHSALLQSLGSLVSAVLTKFINDVEDMSDIAEDESRKLHGYCVSLATLSQHFQTEDGNGETRDMAGIYTPNWFKFQYLSEILDSSLADIKYFWTDGELKLEMEAEEVVGLIEALFAPSDHRRRAIAEIRRTSMT
ncbi:uncharacterized protein ALTATR162_LOCUS8164 [Alternaria atra]|uniref:ZW10 C-terminal helical domain-containing protein n=1 Tax=Alternaria atra TaxID=119953 RepID=A0A8J2N229_9PLEO|nr:uncharacterized protein ALTATR162_LOCUS8164 [Alternaria atra]CAG5175650.1 unnamed protein product [Alternaria atra]